MRLYYLQNRYYNPEIGRFLNADATLGANQDILSYNLFAFCSNNPVRYADYNGENAVDVLKWGWTSAAIVSQADSPVPGPADVVGLAIGIGATVIAGILVIPWDKVGSSISKGWNLTKRAAIYIATSIAISNTVSKAKTKIRNERNRYDYWIAAYIDFGGGKGTYIPTIALSYSVAMSYVRAGGNIFADSKNNAYKLAKAVGGGMPARDPAHGGLGYWRHYHATRGGKRIGGHIFYV
jgi:hypothetical protein